MIQNRFFQSFCGKKYDNVIGAWCKFELPCSSLSFNYALRYIISSAKESVARCYWANVRIIVKTIEQNSKYSYGSVGWVFYPNGFGVPGLAQGGSSVLTLNEFKNINIIDAKKSETPLEEGRDPEPLVIVK